MNTLLRKTLFLLLSTVFCLIPKAKSQVIGGQNVFSFLSLLFNKTSTQVRSQKFKWIGWLFEIKHYIPPP